MTAHEFDVLVIGGGLTGLALAVLLRRETARSRPGFAIGLLEAGPAPSGSPATPGLRVLALSPATRNILERCAAWPEIPTGRIQPCRRMVVWHHAGTPDGARSIRFDAAEEGVTDLGYIAESDVLRASLWARAGEEATVVAGRAPRAVAFDADGVDVTLDDGQRLRARLVVGADGQDSWLRGAIGVASSSRPYGQRALVAHVATGKPHQATAWQRFLPGGPIAFLPLADGRSSIVWSCPEEEAERLVGASEPEFDRAVTAASDGVLGPARVTSPRASFPLASATTAACTGRRWALIGDAAHRVHPLAGQGANLGFLDAASLAETLGRHLAAPLADAGDPRALRQFERWRKAANLSTLAAMDALHHLFTSRRTGLAAAAGWGLGAVDHVRSLKSELVGHATGRRGDVPDSARDPQLG